MQDLLGLLAREGKIVAKDVAAELGISEDSVRRDLRDLAAERLCQRVYGGALPASPAVADYAARQTVAPDGKQKVASVAAGLVRPGGALILDGGTTALAVARALPQDLACTVITHSPTIAAAILASSEKIGTASRFRVLPWEKVSGLITDADPHDAVVERLGALGVEVLFAD